MKPANKPLRLFSIIVAVVLLFIFLHWIKILSPLNNALLYLFSPVQTNLVQGANKINTLFGNLLSIGSIDKENENLRSQLNNLVFENNQLKNLLKESDIVAKETKFLAQKNYRYRLVRIVGQSSDPQSRVFTIDRGGDDGIKVGQAVITDEGIIVGKILNLQKDTAQVILLTDPRAKLVALVQNDTLSKGIVSGTFGLTLKMEWIPKNDLVIQGQYVVTSGLDNNLPEGLVIGQINEISLISGELFQTATIKPTVSYDQLQVLSVIIE